MGTESSDQPWGKGGSLPVDNVQALASNKVDKVPDRYIRTELELENSSFSLDSQLQIPIIDFTKLFTPHCLEDELKKLDAACQEWGFFQLINHGVPLQLMEKMKDDVRQFFSLPLEEKKAYAQLPDSIEGYGQAFVVSEDQKLDWGDMLFLIARPDAVRKMRFWPTNPTSFRETLDTYGEEVRRLVMCLIELMAKNLGVEPKKLTDMFEDQTLSVMMNYYPPCQQTDKVLGLSPHSDATGITLLLQDNEVQGLQIRKGGKWVPIKPIPNAFIINIGDIIEILSNGKYKSIEHRAIVDKEQERISIASFNGPSIDAVIGPLQEAVGEEKIHYKRLSHMEFAMLIVDKKLEGKQRIKELRLSE